MRLGLPTLVLLLIVVVAGGLPALAAENRAADNRAADNRAAEDRMGEPSPVVRVGIVLDGPWRENERIHQMVRDETRTLTAGEFDVRFPVDKQLIADWSLDGVSAAIEQLLSDPEVDIVLAFGPLGSHVMCCYGHPPKPVIAPIVIDAELQGLPRADASEGGLGSGIPNLNYVALPDSLARDLETFYQVVRFRKLAILANRWLLEEIPELLFRTRQTIGQRGFDVEYVPVADSVSDALARLPADADAVIVFPLFQLSEDDFGRLVRALREKRLPSFSMLGRREVELGLLATRGSDTFFPQLARRVALNLQRILLGEDAGTLPVDFATRSELVINMATARAIGVSPRWEVLQEAELLHEDAVEGVRELSLPQAVREAIEANLDLLAGRLGVEVGAYDVEVARAQLLPQVEASASGVVIDEDRAEASFGSQAERSVSGDLTISQLLYSDGARGNVEIRRETQRSREMELEQLRLDLAREAATTYLNLLRARTLERVRKNNLRVTRSNLEAAELRQRLGVANPAELYRWQTQIAADRKSLIDAQAERQAAEVAVNRLLHRPQEEAFRTVEVDLEDPFLVSSRMRFGGYSDTPALFRVFRDFMVREAMDAAPELRQLDAAIAAQERAVTVARRAFWAPSVAAQLSLSELLAKGGAGADVAGGLPGLSPADDTNWSLGISVSLPLFEGGARRAEQAQARLQLEQLQRQQESVAEKIEQRVRSAMHAMGASYAGIELTRAGAEAAHRSLELVVDAYASGAVTILDLLDAQAAALNADLQAANAVYDFFIDLIEVERASNHFDFFLGPQERDAWYQRLDSFYAAAGAEPQPSIDRPGGP